MTSDDRRPQRLDRRRAGDRGLRRDGGRAFHVMVAFGPQASAEVQRQAWAILDSLRVDPGAVPDWKSSP
ncbi:MAG TPA: hypothetical protein VFY32_03860 [Solirubrobacteraceae bacterium]|nr:hypothetical protein [Solirubrobacteraceae bacterium]